MGRKVHPFGFRLGFNKVWRSRGLVKNLPELIITDYNIRRYIRERFAEADIADIEVEHVGDWIRVFIKTARPAIIIGRGGREINKLRQELELMTSKKIEIEIIEVENPALEASLVAQRISRQLEQRVSHRRAMKRAIMDGMRAGANGIKIRCSGRLMGAEIARSEWYLQGRMPLNTLRADIDYAQETAITRAGTIGVKVWIYKGDKPKMKAEVKNVTT
ncbi:30S ribosomal protein S3 [candidate division bacterium WOR-3 4484_18]|uniref:Small ribosomal subunit protein uS3 n=1 Tax=candidate division WOR-3 bacterium 4484_18 TaxID=2020626 RepID=A0A257LVJ8_UNCW3|nr:MAG: 30S ribosomal protein S3 [candidate division bacterium WOR-3 4484_18]